MSARRGQHIGACIVSTTKPFVSTRSQIAGLAVGKCYSRSERLDFDTLTRADLQAANEGLRNAIGASVRRAQDETGHAYITEAGEWRTSSRDRVVTVIVTRIS